MKRFAALAVGSLMAVLTPALGFAAGAEDYPNKPITFIVPLAPGGGGDLITRALADELTKRWGQKVVVENVPGANGIVGATAAVGTAPDGYKILMVYDAHAVNPNIQKNLPYDLMKDFDPLTQILSLPMVIVTNPSIPAQTLDELLALIKSKPGEFTYASVGVGSSQHLATALFAQAAGIEMTHIPYNEGARTAVLNGEVNLMIPSLVSVRPQIEAGQLTAFAVTSAVRAPSNPDLPTTTELGIEDYEFSAWVGYVVPAGTPEDIVNKLNAEIVSIINDPAFLEKYGKDSVFIGSSPAEFGAFMESELDKWAEAAKLMDE